MKSSPITRRRGDTYRIRILVSDETVLPLDGTFLLVVTGQSAPIASDLPVMELVGSIVGAAADGILHFPLTAEEADHVGRYFYEAENTLGSGEIRTIREGPFTMIQDRAKGDPGQTWTPRGVLGQDVVMNGSEFWYRVDEHSPTNVDFRYSSKAGLDFMAYSGKVNVEVPLLPIGIESRRTAFGYPGIFDFTLLIYAESISPSPQIIFSIRSTSSALNHSIVSATITSLTIADFNVWGPNSAYATDMVFGSIGHTHPPGGAYFVKARFDFNDSIVAAKSWDQIDDEPESWGASAQLADPAVMFAPGPLQIGVLRSAIGDIFGIASFEWRRVG